MMIAAGFLLMAIPAALAPLAGHWTLIPGGSDNIPKAVEAAVSKMSIFIRPIARGRLAKTQVAFPSIDILHSDAAFTIRHLGGTAVTHAKVNEPVDATAPDGSKIRVTLSPGPPLTESYVSPEGQRVNTYTLHSDGRKLTVAVSVTSPRLPMPLRYTLVYARQP